MFLKNFQFHKFNINSQRNFYNSNDFGNRKKSRTHSAGFYKIGNGNNNRYSNYAPTNFSQTIPQKNNMNIFNKISQDKFPSKRIISSDFESMLKYGDSSKIDELLPHMIYNDLSFAKNNHLKLVLSNFQTLLKYLFSEQQNLINKNNKIEAMFNNKNSNMNNRVRKKENEEYELNKQLKTNNKQIEELNEKIKIYKNKIINSGKEYLIPKNYAATKSNNKFGLYTCQICLGKTFKTYEDFQEHYIKEHTNNKIQMNKNYKTYNNITKSYLDNKLNKFKDEVKNIILNIQDQKNNRFENNFKENEKINSKANNNIKMSNFNLINNEDENINEHLNRLEYEQKEQYEQLNIKINKMKEEVFKELRNLKYKAPLINNNLSKKNDEEEKNNNDKTNNNDITDDTINLIYNQKSSPNNNGQNIELNVFNNPFYNKSSENNIGINKNKINNEPQKQILNTSPIINNIFEKPKKNELDNANLNNQKNENDQIDNTNNITDEIINKEEIIQKNTININHSTGKYIDKSKIIQEESGTVNNQTQNNNTNNQDNTIDNKEKIYTNTGDGVVKSQNKLFISNLNDVTKFSILQSKIEEKDFIDKIKERDEKLLLNKNKNMGDVEEEYEAVKLKNMNLLEKKEEDLIKKHQNKYFDEDNQNLGKDDYEKIIKNIMENNKKNFDNKHYKEFFNNLMKKNKLSELIPMDIKLSNLNITQSKNQFEEINNFRKSDVSLNNFNNNLEKNLGKGNYEDFV